MKKKFLTPLALLVILASLLLAGCPRKTASSDETKTPGANAVAAKKAATLSGNAESLVAKYMNELEDMGALFKKVTDEKSAKRYGPEIQEISARLQAITDTMKGMDPMTKGMAFAAQTQRFMKLQQDLAPDIMRISNDPALSKHLGNSMKLPKMQ